MKPCIKDLKDFTEYSRVFKVFESFPFFEMWTEEEIRAEFDLNLANGHIFGYYEDGICVAFVSMRNQHHNEHPVHYGHESKVLYISDMAVLPNYRQRGIATKLLEHALNVAVSEGYQFAYLRINDNNPMALGIFKKHGFCKEYDYCEVVTRPHTKHASKYPEDFRVFMSKKL